MKLRARSRLLVGAGRLYDWHLAPGAFLCLVPPWEWLRLQGPDRGIFPGCVRKLLVTPVRWPWLALHEEFVPGRHFLDRQLRGPCHHWHHHHYFSDDELRDEIDFQLPLAPLSNFALPLLKAQFERMFLYRHRVTAHYLSLAPRRALRVAVTGTTGLIGRRLVPFLTAAGHQVVRLVRHPPLGPADVLWDPTQPHALPELEGLDAVVHLAGKGVLDGDMGPAHRQQIRSSRVEATRNLCTALKALKNPPETFLCASGSGFYGDHPQRVFDEESPPGPDFLAEVCRDWEGASADLPSRRVLLRIAPVMHLAGSSLPCLYYSSLLTPCSWRFGDGRQPFSWIAMDDVLAIIHTALSEHQWSGAFNLASPQASTLGECAREVGRLLGRPFQASIPASVVGRVAGGRAPLFLGGNRVCPRRALELGYRFQYPELAACLRHSLGRFRQDDQPEGWSFEWAVD